MERQQKGEFPRPSTFQEALILITNGKSFIVSGNKQLKWSRTFESLGVSQYSIYKNGLATFHRL